MEPVQVIGFIPPIVGVDGTFNTFRLGGVLAKRLLIHQHVFLMSEKEKIVFGKAVVQDIIVGELRQMCALHGFRNHTQVDQPREGADERLFAIMQKIYGPHIATENKRTTVVYLRRIE